MLLVILIFSYSLFHFVFNIYFFLLLFLQYSRPHVQYSDYEHFFSTNSMALIRKGRGGNYSDDDDDDGTDDKKVE